MAKQVTAQVKLQCPGGQATPAPPVGPALGQHGVNIGQFVSQFNDKTKDQRGMMIPVVISVDNTWSLKAWKDQLGVEYPLLADFHPKGAVSQAYGVYIDQAGLANRVVVVVGRDGKVAWIQPTEKITDIPDYDPVMNCEK